MNRLHMVFEDETADIATWLCKHGPRGCDDCWGDEWLEKHYKEEYLTNDTHPQCLMGVHSWDVNFQNCTRCGWIGKSEDLDKERNGDTGQALQCECKGEAREREKFFDRVDAIASVQMGRTKR